MIDLISDTVTRPSAGMKAAMMDAAVGDDVFKEDPSINELESYAASLFGMEAALFCPSGTMTNQIALKLHTQPLDEIICESTAHIYQYETGAWAMHSGVSMKLVEGSHGIMDGKAVLAAIRDDQDWLPKTSMVALENTCNKAGGSYYTLSDIEPIYQVCQEKNLKLHLDGARLFNAWVETRDNLKIYGNWFDSISICLSKGLGAPVGSLLLGSKEDIRQARRIRKAFGGGMRQAGFLAAAGLYALQHHVERLSEDHAKSRQLASAIEKKSFVTSIRPVRTNILIFDLDPQWGTAADMIHLLHEKDIRVSAFGPQTIRMVTHLDVSPADIEEVIRVIQEMS